MDCPACNPCNCPDPDFIERNGTWLLGMSGILFTCIGGMLTFFLKSRCTRIQACGLMCERDVLAIDPKDASVTTMAEEE